MEKAKETGFVRRNDGKLLPMTFVKAMTIGIINNTKVSLENIACKCEEIQEELQITKEALYQRFNNGIELMKAIFEMSLTYTLENTKSITNINILSQFENLYICDSTSLPVSEKLMDIFPSSGGSNKKGSIKLQAIFNITTRNFKKLEFFKGTNNDRQYVNNIVEITKKKDLVIFDLGYFTKAAFYNIEAKEAYYVSRVSFTTVFSTETENHEIKRINILEIFKKSNGIVDTSVVIGYGKEHIKCRLVAIKLPEDVANERRRKAKLNSKRKTLPDYQLEFLGWNVMITNTPANMLPKDAVFDIYRIRWQIEIIFKSLKSNLNLDKLSIGGKAQTQCILYGRLILATLLTSVYSNVYELIYNTKNREVSILKFFSIIKSKYSSILQILSKSIIDFKALTKLFFGIAQKSLYEKRKRKSTVELINQYTPSNFLPKFA